jgi:hypothetical protein
MRQFNVVYTTIHVECTHKINNSCNMSYLDTADIKETVILENWLKVNLTSNKPVQPHWIKRRKSLLAHIHDKTIYTALLTDVKNGTKWKTDADVKNKVVKNWHSIRTWNYSYKVAHQQLEAWKEEHTWNNSSENICTSKQSAQISLAGKQKSLRPRAWSVSPLYLFLASSICHVQ